MSGEIMIQKGLWNEPSDVVEPGEADRRPVEIARTTLDDVLAKEIGLTIKRFKQGFDAAETTATRVEIEFGVTIEAGASILVVSTKAGGALTVRASWGQ